MLYPQNGDRIVAIDTVPSLHPIYTGFTVGWTAADRTVRKSDPHVRRRRRHALTAAVFLSSVMHSATGEQSPAARHALSSLSQSLPVTRSTLRAPGSTLARIRPDAAELAATPAATRHA